LIACAVFVSDANQHKGPYLGVIMKCHNTDGTEVHLAGRSQDI
jgi:hypothetical protein